MVTVRSLGIAEVRVIGPRIFTDERGFFLEAWNARTLSTIGIHENFVQDNFAHSKRGVLRGLHYQLGRAQGKLIRVLYGEIFDVAVDLRRSSPTFGQWTGACLSAESAECIWIPDGFAHGYLVTSETAGVYYKATEFYSPDDERLVSWSDPAIGIEWPLARSGAPILAARDAAAPPLANAECFP